MTTPEQLQFNETMKCIEGVENLFSHKKEALKKKVNGLILKVIRSRRFNPHQE